MQFIGAILLGCIAVVGTWEASNVWVDAMNTKKAVLEKENLSLELAQRDPTTINKNFLFVKSGMMSENGKTCKVSVYEGNTAYVVMKESKELLADGNKYQVLIYKKGNGDLTALNLIKQL